MSEPANHRPSVPMSQEEHGALAELTATVRVLATGLGDLKNLVGDLARGTESKIQALSDRGRFSRGDLFGLVSVVVAIAGVITALLSMRIDTALAPLQTQNQVSIVDRGHLHDDVEQIQHLIAAGKDARLAAEAERKATEAVLIERTNELYFKAHGHYPSTTKP